MNGNDSLLQLMDWGSLSAFKSLDNSIWRFSFRTVQSSNAIATEFLTSEQMNIHLSIHETEQIPPQLG